MRRNPFYETSLAVMTPALLGWSRFGVRAREESRRHNTSLRSTGPTVTRRFRSLRCFERNRDISTLKRVRDGTQYENYVQGTHHHLHLVPRPDRPQCCPDRRTWHAQRTHHPQRFYTDLYNKQLLEEEFAELKRRVWLGPVNTPERGPSVARWRDSVDQNAENRNSDRFAETPGEATAPDNSLPDSG